MDLPTQPLARGWTSDIFLEGERGGRPSVLKVRLPAISGFDSSDDTAGLDRAWAREAAALAAIAGRTGVVQLLEEVVVADRQAFRLELVRGTTLSRRVYEHGPMSVRAAVGVLSGVAESVRSIHDSGWLHLDLNPTNVLHDEARDEYTIVDLGASIAIDGRVDWSWPLGRHVFMAPEQLAVVRTLPGPPLSTAADIHQLALLLGFLLTGEHPFRPCSDQEDYRYEYLPAVLRWAERSGREKAAYVRRFAPHVPSEVVEMITACVDPDPGRRLDLLELVEALDSWKHNVR